MLKSKTGSWISLLGGQPMLIFKSLSKAETNHWPWQSLLKLQGVTRRQINIWRRQQEVVKAIKKTGALMLFVRNKKGNSVTTAENNTRGENVQPMVHHVENVVKLIIGSLSAVLANGNNLTKEQGQSSKEVSMQLRTGAMMTMIKFWLSVPYRLTLWKTWPAWRGPCNTWDNSARIEAEN